MYLIQNIPIFRHDQGGIGFKYDVGNGKASDAPNQADLMRKKDKEIDSLRYENKELQNQIKELAQASRDLQHKYEGPNTSVGRSKGNHQTKPDRWKKKTGSYKEGCKNCKERKKHWKKTVARYDT